MRWEGHGLRVGVKGDEAVANGVKDSDESTEPVERCHSADDEVLQDGGKVEATIVAPEAFHREKLIFSCAQHCGSTGGR